MEIFSGAGAYVLLRTNDTWAFVHDVVPDAWTHVSGSGLTVTLRPWAALPAGAIHIPTVRAFAAPWAYGEGPKPEDLPRGPLGEELALSGPVRQEARGAQFVFRLLRGTAAVEAVQEAIRAHICARMLLHASHTFACGAWEARRVIPTLTWEVLERGEEVLLRAEHEGRIIVAGGEWIAAAATLEEALATLEGADED